MKLNDAQRSTLAEAVANAKQSRPKLADATGVDLDRIKGLKAGRTDTFSAAELKALSGAVGVDYKTLRSLA